MSGSHRETVRVQQQEPVAGMSQATFALAGSVLAGALDHFGRADLKKHGLTDRSQIKLAHLLTAFKRGDHGLHGCGFEYAVHAAFEPDSRIPTSIRTPVTAAIAAEMGALTERLRIPVTGWSSGVRSVMFGVERGTLRGPEGVAPDLGSGALVWPSPGDGPYSLVPLLPFLRCPGPKCRRPHEVPEPLSRLWQTDLFLGGADVADTAEVRQALAWREPGDTAAPQAWLPTTVKYRAGQAVGGDGLNLGIETSWTGNRFYVRRPESTVRAVRDEFSVVTLGLDGAFLNAFHSAFRAIQGLAERRPLHPTRFPVTTERELAATLDRLRGRSAYMLSALLQFRHDAPAGSAIDDLFDRGQRDLSVVVGDPRRPDSNLSDTDLIPEPLAA